MHLTNSTLVIKLSGKNINDATCLEDISKQAVALQRGGAQVILVHGGGIRINQALQDAGNSAKFYKGLRVTDDATMAIVAKVLADEVNSQVATAIRGQGGEVICGEQTQVLVSEPLDADNLGRVGKVADVKPISGLAGQIAVIAPVAKDATDGSAYNVNADWAAAAIAVHYKADYLFYMTDQDGVLDEDGKVINKIQSQQIDELIEQGVITDGMIPKVISMRDALAHGVKRIVVVNGANHNIICRVLDGEEIGTSIY